MIKVEVLNVNEALALNGKSMTELKNEGMEIEYNGFDLETLDNNSPCFIYAITRVSGVDDISFRVKLKNSEEYGKFFVRTGVKFEISK